jgi:hypothetical protein
MSLCKVGAPPVSRIWPIGREGLTGLDYHVVFAAAGASTLRFHEVAKFVRVGGS